MSIRCISFFFLLTIMWLTSFTAAGQERCGVPAYLEIQKMWNPQLENQEGFEQWLKEKVRKKEKSGTNLKFQQTVYQLPVVVHVIHNGEPLGTGRNIPNEQILRQIQILNRDFRRLNEEQINNLPPEFKRLAADTQIEFVLALQDPEGLPTSGITRSIAPNQKKTYSMEEDLELKSIIHWPPEDYINIYVADLQGSGGEDLLGYAQFPETDKLQGLEMGKIGAETDGIVIDYEYFGTGGSANSSSLGRTLTHETGHYLGLRHTWGDGGCEVDDYVQDTPTSSVSYMKYSNCSGTPSSCGSNDMFQNFLTYADDACMALFTFGQSERMLVVLQNSPRRKELVNSHAKEPPTIVANDAGIRQFTLAITDACTKSFIPTLVVRNYGSTRINELEIGIFINGILVKFQELQDLNLGSLATKTVTLEEVIVNSKGETIVEARIISVNGTTDSKTFNNRLRTDLFIPFVATPPLLQDFETSLTPFYRVNPDFYLTWQIAEAPISGDTNNLAAYMNFYDYDKNLETRDLLISPILNLENAQEAFLSFRVAYGQYQSGDEDGLEVYVTTDCSESLDKGHLIYRKTGKELATVPPSDDPFRPMGNESWRTEQIDLSEFTGQDNLQLIFAGINDYGNNLYLDNIEVLTESRKELDVALQTIRNPSIVSCVSNPIPSINVRNAGQDTIQSLQLLYSINDEEERKVTYENLGLRQQETIQLEIPQLLDLKEGEYTIRARVVSLNGEFDQNPVNDFLAKNFVIDDSTDVIPLRQSFEGTKPLEDWISISPTPADEGWTIRSLREGGLASRKVAYSEFFDGPSGKENWLVSPILDLSEVKMAGVQFRHSYANLSSASDILQVRVSVDCGQSWNNILFEKRGNELSNITANSRWTPSNLSDWDTSFVDLSNYAGMPEVRVAFVAISGGGNDLFLDEIEFYESNIPILSIIPEPNSMYVAPNPFYASPSTGSPAPKLVFNLQKREDVHLWVFDPRGSLKLEQYLPNTLNQVYLLDVDSWPPGVYLIRAESKSLKESHRLVLIR